MEVLQVVVYGIHPLGIARISDALQGAPFAGFPSGIRIGWLVLDTQVIRHKGDMLKDIPEIPAEFIVHEFPVLVLLQCPFIEVVVALQCRRRAP